MTQIDSVPFADLVGSTQSWPNGTPLARSASVRDWRTRKRGDLREISASGEPIWRAQRAIRRNADTLVAIARERGVSARRLEAQGSPQRLRRVRTQRGATVVMSPLRRQAVDPSAGLHRHGRHMRDEPPSVAASRYPSDRGGVIDDDAT